MKILRDLSSNQAWWVLCTVLPLGTHSTDALERAERTGADWGQDYHVTYNRDTRLYDVILKVDTWLKVSIDRH